MLSWLRSHYLHGLATTRGFSTPGAVGSLSCLQSHNKDDVNFGLTAAAWGVPPHFPGGRLFKINYGDKHNETI